ncbi:MAG TPA: VWA domain-containing protein [Gammaproteobacteria bacterium]|nr:VWA domain-containing protein [Gammaproteobacteria bacterium]
MIDFEWPWMFALIPLPLLLRPLLPPATEHRQAALRTPFLQDFTESAGSGPAAVGSRALFLGALLAWMFLITAAARPQWFGEPVQLPVSGRDLMLAVDLSQSMQEEDFVLGNRAIDRLTAVKRVAGEFIDRREGDRIGLILFGDHAYVQAPLTFDRPTVNSLLQEAFLGLAGERTAIGDAVGLAIKRLQDNPQQRRVLILMTDGANTAGELEPLKAAELAQRAGLKIYTIGIGADAVQRRSFFGSITINPSRDMDEKTLTAIADATGGRYFRAHDTSELAQIYGELDKLEPVEVERQSFRPTRALFYWPLTLAFLLSLLLFGGHARRAA